jgi:hypothetical protein
MAKKESSDNSSNGPAPKDAVLARRLANLRPHNFKKGQSGNPKGRRKGQRDYRTLFWIALEHIANTQGMTAEEVEEALHAAGIVKAIKGDFFFYQEISNRVYGKPTDKMDLTSGGKTIADLITLAHAKRRTGTTRKVQK